MSGLQNCTVNYLHGYWEHQMCLSLLHINIDNQNVFQGVKKATYLHKYTLKSVKTYIFNLTIMCRRKGFPEKIANIERDML